MMNCSVRRSDMDPLFKGILMVLLFGIVAMPPVGIYLTVKKKSILGKFVGMVFLAVGIAAWVSLMYYVVWKPYYI